MHIPDGFLSTPVWLALDAAALAAVGATARRAGREVEETRIPLLGVMGAFVFAAQMVNFPVSAGVSGHLVGGALLAITLGPASAALAMTAILTLQAFVFQDGGVLALGANALNMAFAGVVAGYLPYKLWGRRRVAFFLGGALSVMTSALLALGELLASGVAAPRAVLGFALAMFALNAVAEGAITVAALEGVTALNAGYLRPTVKTRRRTLAAAGAAAAALVAAGVLFASRLPDGLEATAERLGLSERAHSVISSPAAGVAGLAAVCVVCAVVMRAGSRQRSA
jgi:cobalt/nickel transport system permease protein